MAGNLAQVQFAPPSVDAWNLTRDCSSYARFVSTILRKSETATVNLCAVDVYALHEYVAASLPSDFQKSDANFTSPHTAIWYLSVCDRPTSGTSQCHEVQSCVTAVDFQNEIYSMISQAQDGKGACLEELRSSLDVKGNADMAGIGVSSVIPSRLQQKLRARQVMASFCIEAFLIIAFLAAYAVAHFRRNRTTLSRGHKLSDTFRAVLPTFYWSSVLLSLGIIVASLKTSVEASGGGQADQLESWRKGESIYSPYDTKLAATASILSVLPPLMAGIMLRQSSRRRRLLNTTISPFLAILLIPVVVISVQWDTKWDSVSPAGQVVDLKLRDMQAMEEVALTAFCCLVLTMLIGWIVLLCSGGKSGSAQAPSRHSTYKVVFAGLLQAILLVMMIASLIMIFFIRARIIDAEDNSQLEWSFGQVLALTTWIPVVVDFFYTMCGKFRIPGPLLLYYWD